MTDPNLNLPPIPYGEMFVDGVMIREWQEFFRLLFNRVGGVTENNNTTLTEITISETYDIMGLPPEGESPVTDQFSPTVLNLLRRVELLENSGTVSRSEPPSEGVTDCSSVVQTPSVESSDPCQHSPITPGLLRRVELLEGMLGMDAVSQNPEQDRLNIEPINTTTPAGLSGEVQFNKSGALGADSGFFWDNINKRIGVGTNTPDTTAQVVGTTKLGGDTNYTNVAGDGTITLHGDARVRRFIQIPAGGAKAPGLKPATFTSLGLNGAWDFSGVVNNQVSMAFAIPLETDYSGSMEFRIGWSTSAMAGDVVWQVEYLWLSLDDNSNSTTPDATVTDTVTASTTAYGYNTASMTINAPAATDRIAQVKLTRLATDAGDTVTADAYFIGAVIEFTQNELGNSI